MSFSANSCSRQPWSTYAVFLTTLSPPALVGDLCLLAFCYKGTEAWDPQQRTWAFNALLLWMFVSKFIKLLGHYIRYPADFLLLPVSIFFGYFHGLIKLYAAFTLNVVCPPRPRLPAVSPVLSPCFLFHLPLQKKPSLIMPISVTIMPLTLTVNVLLPANRRSSLPL